MLRAQLRSLWRSIFRRSLVEQEMADELQFHLEARTKDLTERAGFSPTEAYRLARIEFGSIETHRDRARASLGLRLLDELRMDARYALRSLGRTPVFTVAAILTLALGMGATTATYSVVHAVLVQPVSYVDSSRVVRLLMQAAPSDSPSGMALRTNVKNWMIRFRRGFR